MTTALAVFVKTPSLSPLKTRLAASIGQESAEKFYKLSLKSIENTIQSTDIMPFWAVAEHEALHYPLWSKFKAMHTGEGDLGQRQHHIYDTLIHEHHKVLLIGADVPQITPPLIQKTIKALDTHEFVMGPARDGGYYLFGGTRSLSQEIWTSVPWSRNITREKLESKLPSKPFHLPLLTDVDTQEDLIHLLEEMPKLPTLFQKKIIEWVTSLAQKTNTNI